MPGDESDLFMCSAPQALSRGTPADPYCAYGCVGADQIYGTLDDTIDPTHAIDQGAICMRSDSQRVRSQMLRRAVVAGAGIGATGNLQQPVVFGCIQFYTTNCVYDVTHRGKRRPWHGRLIHGRDESLCGVLGYDPRGRGYCGGALQTASALSNHAVCMSNLPDGPRLQTSTNRKGNHGHRFSTSVSRSA